MPYQSVNGIREGGADMTVQSQNRMDMAEQNDNLLFSNEVTEKKETKQQDSSPKVESPAEEQKPGTEEAAAPAKQAKEKKPRKPKAPKDDAEKPADEPKGELPQTIHGQLLYLQQHVKVGKGNVNTTGGTQDTFAYRTLEDIYAELKPHLAKLGCTLTISAVPLAIGNYVLVTATARLQNDKGESVETTTPAAVQLGGGSLRFPAQETLASVTMARKGALAGMLLLDDTAKEQQERLTPFDPDSASRPGRPAPAPAASVVPSGNESSALGPEGFEPVGHPLPELIPGSPVWQKMGVKASSGFTGSKEELVRQLRLHYTVSDETAAAFIETFYAG